MSNPGGTKDSLPIFPSPWNGAVLGAFMGWLGGLLAGGMVIAFVAAVVGSLLVGAMEALTARYDRQ